MRLLTPTFYLRFYDQMLKWIIIKHGGRPIPTNEGNKWDVEDKYEQNGQFVLLKVTERELGYAGSYFLGKKIQAGKIIKNGLQDNVNFDSDLLYNSFLKLNLTTENGIFLELLDNFYLYDKTPSYIIEEQNKLLERDKTSEDERFKPPFGKDPHVETVRLVVQQFYDNMASKRLKECWDVLSPSFKAREPWYGDFEEFEKGFTNTRGIKNPAVFNSERRSNSIIECMVYYEDFIESHIINDVKLFESMSLRDIDEFSIRVKKMQDKVLQAGGTEFSKMPLQKLFDPVVSEYIWYKSKISRENFSELFPVKKTTMVKRLYNCSCLFEENKWFIDNIVQDKTYTTR